jgi:hypothetical protein
MYLAFAYDANKNKLARLKFGSGNGTFTTPEGTAYIKFCTYSNYSATYNHDISINYPSTDHDYHPYTGRSITIDLGQTVYGGKLDVLSGELTVDRAMVDLGTLNWNMNTSGQFYGLLSPYGVSDISGSNVVCSQYVGGNAYGGTADGIICVYGSSHNVWARNSRYSSDADFKTAMNGVQLCYELATPIEIQLSANQLNSLYGVNNLWADSGDTEVEYRADTKAYIAKKIAEAIASLT